MKSFFLKVALSFAVVGAVVACSKSEIEEIAPMQPSTDDIAQEGEVRIAVPEGTRSTLVDNGDGTTDLRWTSGDAIKLVARNASGEDAFAPCVFYFWANTNQIGKSYFRTPSLYGDGKESEPMPEGNYTYYAVSPSTATIEGTTAKFTLPATQNGEFSADVDFMVAKATGKALVACQGEDENGLPNEDTDPVNDLSLVFKHKSHILRFAIPANNLGQKVKKLHMIFPTAVAGTMAVNMDNGAITSTENTSNKITVEFAEPKDAGDEFYVMILPQANVFSKSVDMRFEAVDGTTFSMSHQVNFPQACSEHKLTPVRMSIPAESSLVTINFNVDYSQLGEPVDKMTISMPDGYYLPNYVSSADVTVTNNVGSIQVYSDMIDDVLRTTSIPAVFDSEHAIVSGSFKLGSNAISNNTLAVSVKAPYLFFEDFSSVENLSSNDEWGEDMSVQTPPYSKDAQYFLNETWAGGRIGTKASTSIRIACRREWTARYGARVDSAPISNLKGNASVNVKVQFDYGMDQEKYAWGSTVVIGQTCYMGYTTEGFPFASGDETGTFNESFYIKEDNNASWTKIPYNKTYNISNCTSSTRLALRTYPENSRNTGNNTCWLYIDNIRVSIAQ